MIEREREKERERNREKAGITKEKRRKGIDKKGKFKTIR